MNITDPGQYNQEMTQETTTTVQNPWAPFFGELDPDMTQQMDFTGDRRGGISADQRFRHETYNLPEAYKGKSRHLEDVLDFMIRKEDEFYTRDLMPWEYTDDIHVQWDVFKFNRTIADIEPEQGIPRLVTAQTEGQSASLLRRGLAFQLEHGFFTTERGKKHFMLNLQQITDAIHTTAYFGVIHALLTGKEYYKEWRRKYGNVPKRRGNVYLRERNTWAILQKSIKGLYILDARAKHDMGLQNVRPNVIVMPSKASMYAQMVPTSEVDYARRGPGAHEALASGKMETTFRGSKVFEAESFDVDFSDQNVDLLSRTKMIGEYFIIDYDQEAQIFDADEDQFMPISYHAAAAHALNANDDIFNKDYLTEHSHKYITPPDHNKNVMLKLNKFKNLLSAAQARAFDNALDPRISPDQAKKDGDRQLSEKQKKRRTTIRGNVNTGKKNILGLALNTYHGKDAANPGDGDDEDGKLNKESLDALNIAIAEYSTEAPGLTDDSYEADPVRYNVMGFESTAYAGAVTQLNTALDAALGEKDPKGKVSPKTDQIAAVADKLNALTLLEDTYAVVHRIVTTVNYRAHHKVILFRPFATWRMGSAIIAQGGNELGSTFHGHHDFQLSDDVVRKTILGHYTFYSKAVVKRPKHYCIEEDVHCQGYVSGGGTQFFTESTLRDALEQQAVGTEQNRHDLVAWIMTDGKEYTKPVHMSGRLPESVAEYDDSTEHFDGCSRMRAILEDMNAFENGDDDTYMGGNNNLNFMCFRGAQLDENNQVKHLNKGHWGELTYDGCMAIRTGEMVEKNEQRVLVKGKIPGSV